MNQSGLHGTLHVNYLLKNGAFKNDGIECACIFGSIWVLSHFSHFFTLSSFANFDQSPTVRVPSPPAKQGQF
jgi:hypothetical protein